MSHLVDELVLVLVEAVEAAAAAVAAAVDVDEPAGWYRLDGGIP